MSSEIHYTDSEHLDSDLMRLIETGSTTEAIAARMLKAQIPLLKEIIASHNVAYLSGFVRGISGIVATMVVSLPPELRIAVAQSVRSDFERALEIALKGPPQEQL